MANNQHHIRQLQVLIDIRVGISDNRAIPWIRFCHLLAGVDDVLEEHDAATDICKAGEVRGYVLEVVRHAGEDVVVEVAGVEGRVDVAGEGLVQESHVSVELEIGKIH